MLMELGSDMRRGNGPHDLLIKAAELQNSLAEGDYRVLKETLEVAQNSVDAHRDLVKRGSARPIVKFGGKPHHTWNSAID